MQINKEYISERSVIGLHSESSGDYPLPDYNSGIKRVLTINSRVVPTGRFITENSVEFSGAVFYDVVYIDSENNLSCADFSTDYEIAVKIDPETYEDSCIDTAISGCTVRLIGPRKISAKCSLTSDVRIMEKKYFEVSGDAMDSGEPEILTANVKVISSAFASGDTIEYREEILSIDGAIEDEVGVLMCDLRGEVSSVSCDGGGADVKGDITAALLYKNADSPILVKNVRLPYSAHVNSDAFDDCVSLIGRIDISALKTEIVPTEDGVLVYLSFGATPFVRGLKNNNLEVVRDSYFKERGTTNEYGDFSYCEHICTESKEVDFGAKLPLSEVSDSDISAFSYVSSFARIDECNMDDSGVRIKGEIRFTAIASEESEEKRSDYTSVKFTVPFEEYVNVNCQKHDNMRIECHAKTMDDVVEIVDNHAVASCKLALFVTLNANKKQRCLGASYLDGEEFRREDSVITVYYPDERESVFDIAKKFHTSVQCIAEDNELSQSVFASPDAPVKPFGYKKLIIK